MGARGATRRAQRAFRLGCIQSCCWLFLLLSTSHCFCSCGSSDSAEVSTPKLLWMRAVAAFAGMDVVLADLHVVCAGRHFRAKGVAHSLGGAEVARWVYTSGLPSFLTAVVGVVVVLVAGIGCIHWLNARSIDTTIAVIVVASRLVNSCRCCCSCSRGRCCDLCQEDS